MFLDFYNLREEPFGVTPDPKYLYMSPTHREALASLLYGVQCDRGFMTLIAKPGMGKTTLIFCLLERLRNSAKTAFLFQTQCTARELLRHLLADLGIDSSTQDMVEMHQQLNKLLLREAERGRRVVVIIDEAQNLTDEALESVRLLSNFETASAKLIQLILAGQPPLAEKLASPGLAQLRQRLSIRARLERFTPTETDHYISHRLKVAGIVGENPFDLEARTLIAAFSEGIPRNINNLCFNALTLGSAMQKRTVDGPIVREVAHDLEIPSLGPAWSALEAPRPDPLPAQVKPLRPADQGDSPPALAKTGGNPQSEYALQALLREAREHAALEVQSFESQPVSHMTERVGWPRRTVRLTALGAALSLFAICPSGREYSPDMPRTLAAATALSAFTDTMDVGPKGTSPSLGELDRGRSRCKGEGKDPQLAPLAGLTDGLADQLRQAFNPDQPAPDCTEARQPTLSPRQVGGQGESQRVIPPKKNRRMIGTTGGVQ